MKELKLFEDRIHGYTAYAMSKTTAWGLIRNKCHEDGKVVPTIDNIKEVNPRPTTHAK